MSYEVIESIKKNYTDHTREGQEKLNNLIENLQTVGLKCPRCKELLNEDLVCTNPKCRENGERQSEEKVKKYNDALNKYLNSEYRFMCPNCKQLLFSTTDLNFERRFTGRSIPAKQLKKSELFCINCFQVFNIGDIWTDLNEIDFLKSEVLALKETNIKILKILKKVTDKLEIKE